jgi:putative phosphoesterase
VLSAASLVVHVGDLTARSVLDELEAMAPVAAVRGNADDVELRARLPERLVVAGEALRIGVVHDAGRAAGRHGRLLGWFPDCDVVAYGHTHAPEVVRVGPAWVVNPGSPTERRRSPVHSFAVIRGGVPELVVLD